MNKILLGYLNDLKSFVCNKYILLLTFITVALGYGFALTNSSISTDDTAASLYFQGGELIAQGRFFPVIISKILGGMNFTPFWLEFMAIIMMVLAGFLYLCLFKKVTKDKLGKVAYILFIPVFISYPLINEIFIFNTAVISIGIGYLFTAISTIFVYEFVVSKKKLWPMLVAPLLLMMAVVSTYESFVTVFLLGMFMILFLQYLYNYRDLGFDKKIWIKYICIFSSVIAVAILLEFAVTNIYINMHHIVPSKNAEAGVVWFGAGGIIGNIIPFINSMRGFVDPWCGYLPGYLSMIILQLSTLALFIFATIKSIIHRNYWLILFAIALFLSILSLSFVQGRAVPFRACQGFAIFVAFVVMVIYDQTPKRIKPLMLLAVIYLVTMQTYDLTKWFYNDNLRYQEERTTMITVAETIKRDFDATKPVIFIGEYQQGSVIRHGQTNGYSFINWGKYPFPANGPGEQLLRFLDTNGEYLVRPTLDQYTMARENLDNMARWPKAGSIVEYKGVNVVRF
ncbi:MAG: glucosyltransferase domain-containing protein [Candidatus Saccharibacteria bacterium]